MEDALKVKLRRLKKLERTLRPGAASLVFDRFFALREPHAALYTLDRLAGMDRAAYKQVVDEYFAHVYYRIYRERGLASAGAYDPALLAELGLPPDADAGAVKRRFHQLALLHHPDQGGDARAFIRLMERYRALIGKS